MATVRRSHPHQQRVYTKQDVRIYKIAVRFVFVCKYVTSFFCGWGDGGGNKAGTPGPYPIIRRSTPPSKQWLCWSTFPMHPTPLGLSSTPLLFFLVCSVPSAFISLFSHVQTEFPSFWYDFWRALHPPTGVLREPPCSVAASPFSRHTMTSVNI